MKQKYNILKAGIILTVCLLLGAFAWTNVLAAAGIVCEADVHEYVYPYGTFKKIEARYKLYWTLQPSATGYAIYYNGEVFHMEPSDSTFWIVMYEDVPYLDGKGWDYLYGPEGTYHVKALFNNELPPGNLPSDLTGIEGPITYSENPYVSPDETAVTKDPINITNGNMFYKSTDAAISSLGPDLEFTRTYHSRSNYNGPLGYGWTHTFNQSLQADFVGNRVYRDASGLEYTFYYSENGNDYFVNRKMQYAQLVKNADNTWTITKKDGTQYNFNTSDQLTSIVDRNSNTLTLTYANNLLTSVTDSTGRSLTLNYNADNRIIELIDPANNSIAYSYDRAGNLIQSADKAGHVTVYTYDTVHNMTKITDPENKSTYFVYDGQDRAVGNWNDNNYNKTILVYEPENKTTKVAEVKNESLTAVLVTDVSHGTLDFNPDGTFSYTPNQGYVGTDSFTYKANDGTADSEIKTVTITVKAP